MMKVVVGAVGSGGISRFHFQAFAETNTPVRIIADIDKAKAQPNLDRFKAEYTNDWKKVVSHPDVTTVTVFAPTALHYPVAKAALQNGKNVICEKTLTLSPDESLELGRLAESKDLIFYTSYMKRFFPASQKAKELMPSLGHIMSVYCRTYQGFGGANMHSGEIPAGVKPGPDGVSFIVKMAGGGVLICGGSHIMDLLLFLVGKPTTIDSRSFTRPGLDIDIMHHSIMDLPDGGVVHFEANWHPLKKIGYQGRGWDEGFEINGVDGRLVLQTPTWDQPETAPALLRHYHNKTETWTDYACDVVNPFVLAEKFFLSQMAKQEQGSQDRYTGYRADLLLDTCRRSAQEGRKLELKWQA
jgi:predicted dehydrogenase